MDFESALTVLNINFNKIELTNLTHDYIKKNYHKQSLKWHPDKNSDADKLVAHEKFQQINEAYLFLTKELSLLDCDDNETDDMMSNNETPLSYSSVLKNFFSGIMQGSVSELLVDVVKNIILNYKTISLKLFADLDKQQVIEIYNLLYKYQYVFGISDDTICAVSSIIREKYKNDKIYIIKPSIHDLLDNNLYKLYIDDELYLVPLWHHELYFDSKCGDYEIVVLCNPDLEPDIAIADNNDIHITKNIQDVVQLIKADSSLGVDIGNKHFNIPVNKLLMKKNQTYVIKNQGIARICENDIYTVNNKSNIIVTINVL